MSLNNFWNFVAIFVIWTPVQHNTAAFFFYTLLFTFFSTAGEPMGPLNLCSRWSLRHLQGPPPQCLIVLCRSSRFLHCCWPLQGLSGSLSSSSRFPRVGSSFVTIVTNFLHSSGFLSWVVPCEANCFPYLVVRFLFCSVISSCVVTANICLYSLRFSGRASDCPV